MRKRPASTVAKRLLMCCTVPFVLASCSLQQKIGKAATADLLLDKNLSTAHIGICIYEPASNKYWYNYQADKYFIPASNTKIFTTYAALKCLGDSLPAMRCMETATAIYLQPTGDPTFLHPDFKNQPLVTWLQQAGKKIIILDNNCEEKPLGYGWSWDDYNAYYMAERNALPVYGNVIKWTQVRQQKSGNGDTTENDNFVYSDPEVDWKVRFNDKKSNVFSVTRKRDENVFEITEGKELLKTVEVPFVTNGLAAAIALLKDTLHQTVYSTEQSKAGNYTTKYAQATDSMLHIMMHRSDNFMAEQTLLMAANEKLGVMNDAKIIDTLLKVELKDLPEAPTWVDGSGLSRFNLFSPGDFVWVLNKMKQEFPWQRLTTIFPSADSGTLKSYYAPLRGNLYAKTGTLTGHVALSGYFTTRKQKQLIFSVLVNNHQASTVAVRRAVEKFLLQVAEKN
jgi:D-alanyl-D-alanine carboxypeptidase/D-alanyl-D-alanine-endopeptidase (penicillin-binding protein 4)